MVFELLKTGNFQAQLLMDCAPFRKGEDVNLQLISNDMVAVISMDEQLYEEYNFDTHADYDKV